MTDHPLVERLLLYVEPGPGMTRATDWALQAARCFGCRVFAASVLTATPPDSLKDAEERAWETLYEIEDDAFRQDTRISLLLEQGDPLSRIVSLAANYAVELAVLTADTQLSTAELVRKITCPVVFVR